MITKEELSFSLNQLLTSDFNGPLVKKQALIKILSPLLEALVQCEAYTKVGSVESSLAFYTLKLYVDTGLKDALGRDHEEVYEDAKKHFG